MRRSPFSPQRLYFARGGVLHDSVGIIFAVSALLDVVGITIRMQLDIKAIQEAWKTMVFTTLCIAQMGHALNSSLSTRLTIERNNLICW